MTSKLQKDSDELLVRHQKEDIEKNLADIYGARFIDYRKAFSKAQQYYNYCGEIPAFPLTVSFELTNKCNLACVMCFHGTQEAKKEKLIGLTSENISSILEECKTQKLPSIILGSGTEFLFANGSHEVIRQVAKSGIMDVFLRTNGILMDKAAVDLIFEANITRVFISLDAATRETYIKVRRRDSFELIEKNIHYLLEEKKRRGIALPIVRVSFVVLPENKEEQNLFLEKWKDKVDYVDFQRHQDLSHLFDAETNIHSEDIAVPLCSYPFYNLSVLPDGNVAPCCTYYGKDIPVGNINEQTLEEIWHGEKINLIRQQILTKKFNDVCKRCLFFRDDELNEMI